MTATSFNLWAPLVVAALVTALVTPLSILIAPKVGAMDVPKDKRRVHNKPMPRFGGIALYAGIQRIVVREGYPDELAVEILKEAGLRIVMLGETS